MSRTTTIIGTGVLVTGLAFGSLTLLPPHLLPAPIAHAAEPIISSVQGKPQEELAATAQKPADAAPPQKAKPKTALLVSVVSADTQTHRPIVTGFGEVSARWATSLTAEVSGRVDHVSEKLLVGSAFEKGDLLARINTVDYQSALASAKANLASAQVAYLEQQRETQQAKQRWELSGLKGTPSALTLQTPQLEEAAASLASAKAALAKAEKDLSRTNITAPFNGRVSTRSINPGGYVSAGSTLGEVFATDVVEINIALSDAQFALLGNEADAIGRDVTLVDTSDSQMTWSAKIARYQYHIDNTERTRNLVLEVSSSHAADTLMPGTFVSATIPGQAMAGLVKLPASSLARDGYVWYTENNTLKRFKADVIYRDGDAMIVKALPNQQHLDVVRYPQTGFLPGQIVDTKPATISTNQAIATPSPEHITPTQQVKTGAGV